MLEFLKMGGYAAYVWSAYAICAMGFALNTIISRSKYSNEINRLKRVYETGS